MPFIAIFDNFSSLQNQPEQFCLPSLTLCAARKRHFKVLPGFSKGGNCHSAWHLADLSPKQFCPTLCTSMMFQSIAEQQSDGWWGWDQFCTCKAINNQPHTYPVPVWLHWYSRSSIHSFDEELELYEMLDLDANGKYVNVDEDTGRAVPHTHIWLWPYSLQL